MLPNGEGSLRPADACPSTIVRPARRRWLPIPTAAALISAGATLFCDSTGLLAAADNWTASPAPTIVRKPIDFPQPTPPIAQLPATEIVTAPETAIWPTPQASAAGWLERLSNPDPRVRRHALEDLETSTAPIPAVVRRRVTSLAAVDPDPLVQGRAQLLQIEWSLKSLPADAAPSSAPQAMTQTPVAKTSHVEIPPAPAPAGPQSEAPVFVEAPPEAVTSAPRTMLRLRAPVQVSFNAGEFEAGSLNSATAPAIAKADSWNIGPEVAPPEAHPAPRQAWWDAPVESELPIDGTQINGDENEPAGHVSLAALELEDELALATALPPSPLEIAPTAGDPDVLFRPLEQPEALVTDSELIPDFDTMVYTLRDAPPGHSGPSSVAPSEGQTSGHFVPVEDRWRVGLPYWDRYDKGHPPVDDYPFVEGHKLDPFNQNVIKGDYPIIGQHTFLNTTATSNSLFELRNVPTGTTPFESTVNPFQNEFFGNPQQFFYNQNFILSFDLFHGNAAFKPIDWRVKVTPTFNLNYLDVNELGVVSPDVRFGTTRARQDFALQEWFVEKKLADLSPDYDFMSVRAGSQNFNSDFRGFIFADVNRGVRVFGTRNANRDQFNLAVFDMLEKETNSGLNSPHDREQTVAIANYYRQDFIYPGYTAQASFHYNNDGPSTEFDHNDFLARPDPAGVFREHRVEAYYMGITGDGHMGRINVNNAFYWVVGRDSFNPLAGREQTISAQMAALELSYDRDWARFRGSFLWFSGDDNILDKQARGFDSIMDNPAFAGGGLSYIQRQNIRLFGVGLFQRESFVPDLRSSKNQGQANFVNPGLFLYNLGLDADITPKVKLINNVNFLYFHKTEILERFTFQDNINHDIGVDMSTGIEYRPFHNDNVIILTGMALFLPGAGFDDLFGVTDPFATNNSRSVDAPTMFQAFTDITLTF